jgi:hypothetical protein
MRLSSMTKTFDHLLYLNVTVEFDSLDPVDSDPFRSETVNVNHLMLQ